MKTHRQIVAILALMMCLALPAWSSGTVTPTLAQIGSTGIYTLSLAWTSASDGTATWTGSYTAALSGLFLYQAQTIPSATNSPNALYDIVVNDAAGTDLMSGALADRSATVAEIANPATSTKPITGALSIAISNAGNAGRGTLILFFSRAPAPGSSSATISGAVTQGNAGSSAWKVTNQDSGGGDVTDATNHAIKTEPYLAGVALSVAAPMPTTYSVPASNYANIVSTGTTAETLLGASTSGQSIVVDGISAVNADSTNGWILHLCDGACSTSNWIAIPVPKASASGDFGGAVIGGLNFSTASNALLGVVCSGACSTNVTVSITYHWLKR